VGADYGWKTGAKKQKKMEKCGGFKNIREKIAFFPF